MTEKNYDVKRCSKETKLPEFEAGLPWHNVHNVNAANSRRLVYVGSREVYVDEDGCPVRDKFGQPIG